MRYGIWYNNIIKTDNKGQRKVKMYTVLIDRGGVVVYIGCTHKHIEMKDYNIREVRTMLNKGMLREPFSIVSGGEKMGTWYPGSEGLVRALYQVIGELKKVVEELSKKL